MSAGERRIIVCRRAQKLAFQAIDQPVEASPRRSKSRREPLKRSGVAAVISLPGCSPQSGEVWR
jgi:hypothetical protein